MASIKRKNFHHSKIVAYWRQYERDNGVLPWRGMVDWGEPNCMACEMRFATEGKECRYWAADEECKHIDPVTHWNKFKLEKCHVVPLHMGGIDDVSNIVLLCSDCHDAQPDSRDPQITYEWMQTRPRMLLALMEVVAMVVSEDTDLSHDEKVEKALIMLGYKTG